ncbi:hypothetical protein QOZ80_7AG0574300 [Eleusine coracana subsp. coracana]|nr:hypothetical protein QOZ80_7AG0574300 [Eleusine coracana subsp. coracana]
MLRLRNHLLPAASSLQRVLFLSTAAAYQARFDVENFLITRCGLTPAQALKSSRHLAHLKSPSNPEAVLAFLSDAGFAKADIATAISREPRLLCTKVGETLRPRIGMLRDMGLSVPQISRLTATAPFLFRSRAQMSRLPFHLSLLGSFEKLCSVLGRSWGARLLVQDVERVVKPNLVFLQQCGLPDCEIAKLHLLAPIALLEPESAKEIVVCADKLGVSRKAAMFKHALYAVYLVGPGSVDAKMDSLKKALGCSEADLRIAVRRVPTILTLQLANVSHTVEFLKTEVGLEVEYICRRPPLLAYSTKKRLMPRHCVLKLLKANGLIKKDLDFFNVVGLSETAFTEKYLDPYKDIVPGLTSAYAAAFGDKFFGSSKS